MQIKNEIKNLTWNKRMEVLRAIKGWSQSEAAENCGTNQKTYWQWETGVSYPRTNSQKAIANAFGVGREDIFSEESGQLA